MDQREVTMDLAAGEGAVAQSGWPKDALRLALWSIATTLSGFDDESYRAWAARETSASPGLGADTAWPSPNEGDKPIITLIIVHAGDQTGLCDTLASIAKQAASGIEIVVSSPSAHAGALAKRGERADNACLVKNVLHDGCLAEAEASAIGVARGQFVAFLSEGDRLADGALSSILLQLAADSKLDVIYSDEDWIEADGKRLLPRFKTQWDPYAQYGFDLPGRLCVMRTRRVKEVGGLRAEHEPAHHYDLHLRLGEHLRSYRIAHIPNVLYHRRVPVGMDRKTLDAALEIYAGAARRVASLATGAPVEPSPVATFVNKIVFPIPAPAPLVTVMVPTRDRAGLLRDCTHGILTNTSYPNLELLILDNDSSEPETAELFSSLAQDPRVRILSTPGPFNYSRINNLGAQSARGEILLLLNNDVQIINPKWLTEMVRLVMQPDVGCVGAKLLYADRTIQHAGIILDKGPLAMHAFRRLPADAPGYEARLAGVCSYSAVTAACLAVRYDVFMQIGGFDAERLQIAYNDVDLCLKTEELGYTNLCTPFEPLFHLEGASRAAEASPEKQAQDRREQHGLFSRWPDRILGDRFAHPNIQWSWDGPMTLVETGRK